MAQIDGSDFSDTLAGGSENDTITGFDGNDLLTGGTGADVIRGGTGNDRISGYTATSASDGYADQLFGEDGNDFILVGDGDSADGGTGNDVIEIGGSTGPTALVGGTGTDTLRVDNNYSIALSTITGFERLEAATDAYGTRMTAAQFSAFSTVAALDGGTDVYFYLQGGGAGTMNFSSEIARANIIGSSAAESLTLGAGGLAQIVYEGGSGNATVTAGAANDILSGGTGSDILRGGAGSDRISGYTTTSASDGVADQLFGQDGNDYILVGDTDSADGGAGDDVIEIRGSTGPASLVGGAGIDTLRVDNNYSIALSTITGFERLEAAADSYGTRMTAAQFSSFATIAAINGGTDVNIYLQGGGTGTMNFAPGVMRATIIGSSGSENLTLAAGSATQVVYEGGSGNSTIAAGGANDILSGGTGSDILRGGAGNDRISGYTAAYAGDGYADQLFGQDGNDFLLVGDGDSADGGTGNDMFEILGSTGPVSLVGGTGTDTVRVANGNSIAGSTLASVEVLQAATDYYGTRMTAGQFASFASVTAGPGGNDVYFYLQAGGTGTMNLGADIIKATILGSSGDENLTLAATSSAQIEYSGGSGSTNFVSRGGDDTLEGGGGADTLRGGAGNDQLHAYFDYSFNDNAPDQLFGEDGNDYLTLGTGDIGDGGAGNDTLVGSSGNETLTGGAGIDTVSYQTSSSPVTVNLNTVAAQNTGGGGVDLLSGFENVIGGTGNDTLTGTTAANVLTGGAGNDVLNGGDGLDTASYAGTTAAVTVNLGLAGAQNTIGAGTDTLNSIENLTGGGGNDTLTGSGVANVIEGGAGDDTIAGLGGVDFASYESASSRVVVSLALAGAQNTLGAGTDTLTAIENLRGSRFGDTLTGNDAANRLEGLASGDRLLGAGGNDTLVGGDGSDTLDGGAGVDQFDGGAGNDVFDFNLETDSPLATPDVILAFDGAGALAGDRIDFAGIDANTGVAGDQGFTFGSTAAGGLSLVTSGTDTLVQLNTDGDAAFEFVLRITDGATLATAYTAVDFVL